MGWESDEAKRYVSDVARLIGVSGGVAEAWGTNGTVWAEYNVDGRPIVDLQAGPGGNKVLVYLQGVGEEIYVRAERLLRTVDPGREASVQPRNNALATSESLEGKITPSKIHRRDTTFHTWNQGQFSAAFSARRA